MRLTKVKETCSLCGINLYAETGNRPHPDAMPCGIDRRDNKEKMLCPFETELEQQKNWVKQQITPPGKGISPFE